MEIKYSQKIDKEMFEEVNKMGKALTPVFGFKFPKLKFDKRLMPLAKILANISHNFLDEKKLKRLIKKLYGRDLPGLTVYINTTPFSSWNTEKNYLSISYTRNDSTKFFSTICHEANHLMYDMVFRTKKYQDTKIKETLTILNNAFGVEDCGWENFSKQRKKVLKFYLRTKNLTKTLEYTKNLYKK